jgi:hypothetical protein
MIEFYILHPWLIRFYYDHSIFPNIFIEGPFETNWDNKKGYLDFIWAIQDWLDFIMAVWAFLPSDGPRMTGLDEKGQLNPKPKLAQLDLINMVIFFLLGNFLFIQVKMFVVLV